MADLATGREGAGETSTAQPARSRRSLLAMGLGGLAGAALSTLGLPRRADAAAGQALIIGSEANDAGTQNTQLITNSPVIAFKLLQNGPGSALMGYVTPASGATRGVYGRSDSPDGNGVQARNGAAYHGAGAALAAIGNYNHGLDASATGTSGVAVRAVQSSLSTSAGAAPAVQGLAASGAAGDAHPGGSWVRAAGEFSGPNGIIGAASGDVVDGYGVIGTSDAASGGRGVHGEARAATGLNYGVSGSTATSGAGGSGVYGLATSSAGQVYGVQGVSYANTYNSTGVRGYASGSSASTNGVWGAAASTSGVGVYGTASSTYGAPNGILGYAPSNGYALYGSGHAYVSGTLYANYLTKGGGSFQIDHPIDPANKFLFHSFVESPDMMNVYNGIVALDASGVATVTMPEWFDHLNRDFRYQLTSIGVAAPDLHVKSEMVKGSFSIAGGTGGQRVSWQVTGIRRDAWANAHRIEVEVPKKGREKGKYLHPTEHGKPASAGINVERPAPKASPLAKANQGSSH